MVENKEQNTQHNERVVSSSLTGGSVICLRQVICRGFQHCTN